MTADQIASDPQTVSQTRFVNRLVTRSCIEDNGNATHRRIILQRYNRNTTRQLTHLPNTRSMRAVFTVFSSFLAVFLFIISEFS